MAAMISSEVQRTLVKSPPELWAELSDPTALARHLGELGEIRIVRVEPERTVEWAAENATGTVSIKPSGWGTNVKLTVTREPTGAEPAAPGHVEPAPVSVDEREPVIAEPEPQAPAAAGEPNHAEPGLQIVRDPEPVAVFEAKPETAFERLVQPEPRRSFFARVFRRRRATTASPPAPELASEQGPEEESLGRSSELRDPFAAVREALSPERFAASHPFAALPSASTAHQPDTGGLPDAVQSNTDGPATATMQAVGETRDDTVAEEPRGGTCAEDISAQLTAAEEVAAEEVAAVLTAVLDRLGAAHHRPFSRA